MLKDEELYEGLSKEKVEGYRKEVKEKYGEEALSRSEAQLKQMTKAGFEQLKSEAKALYSALAACQDKDPGSTEVQDLIHKHYLITRIFWGTTNDSDPQWDAYKGLGNSYLSEPAYIVKDGKHDEKFALFLNAAMSYYVEGNKSA